MGIFYEDLNDDLILKDLGEVCLSEEVCGGCTKEACLVGYAKQCLLNCVKNKVTYVENGMDKIPVEDMKVYHEEDMAAGIANILKTCRSCGTEHFDNCIINVLRSCYEVALFGEEREYTGSSFAYLVKLQEDKKIHSDLVLDFYNQK